MISCPCPKMYDLAQIFSLHSPKNFDFFQVFETWGKIAPLLFRKVQICPEHLKRCLVGPKAKALYFDCKKI